MYSFKTEWCPFNHDHNKSICAYAHNWQDFRREPFCGKYSYSSQTCPNWDPEKYICEYREGCPNEMQCPFSHGWKEQHYHPDTYKTVPCANVALCKLGRECPYYHDQKEKRIVAAPSASIVGSQVQAPGVVFCHGREFSSSEVAPAKLTISTSAHAYPFSDMRSEPGNEGEDVASEDKCESINVLCFTGDQCNKQKGDEEEKQEVNRNKADRVVRSCPLTPEITRKKYKKSKVLEKLHSDKQESDVDEQDKRKLRRLLKNLKLEAFYENFIRADYGYCDLLKEPEEICKKVGLQNEAAAIEAIADKVKLSCFLSKEIRLIVITGQRDPGKCSGEAFHRLPRQGRRQRSAARRKLYFWGGVHERRLAGR